MRNNRTLLGHLYALFCVIVWGTTFIFSKTLMLSVTPVQLMWLRFLLAWGAMCVIYPKWHFKWRDEAVFLLLSLFANTLYFLAENTALKLTQTSNVSILVTTAPIMTALLLRIFRGDRITKRQITGFSVAFFGVVLVVLNGMLQLQLRPLGDILALAAALCWAVYSILVRHCSEEFSSFLITRKLMFYGLLSSTPLLFLETAPDIRALLTAENILSLLYLALVGSALCYVLWNTSIQRIGAMKTNVYIYAIPLVTLAAGAAILKEKITLTGMAGILLVIFGMFLSGRKTPGGET